MSPDDQDAQARCQLSSSDPDLTSSETQSYVHGIPPSPLPRPHEAKVPGSLSSEAILHDIHFEHYEISRRDDGSPWELGRGAMGVTYKAFDTRLHYPVALKVVHTALLRQHPVMRERFLREARVAARLRHSNVASVFHLGERADGACFYAMELIEGETLAERVRRRGLLPPSLALDIAIQATRGLIAAAQADLVHRDLKPANLMLIDNPLPGSREGSRDGIPFSEGSTLTDRNGVLLKIIDFGLARVTTADAGEQLTAIGGFVGTPQYASPEQLAADDQPVDARSDIYSLGSTIWYALCGKQPFTGGSLEEIYRKQIRRDPPTAELREYGVPEPLIEVLQTMLAANPDDRPETPYALAELLHQCRLRMPASDHDGAPTRGRPAVAAKPFGRRKKAGGRLRVTLGILVLFIAGVAGWAIWSLRTGHLRISASVTAEPTPPPRPPGVEIPAKSVAVLPFENRSDDKENAFFADGIQDDLLTSLVKISDLRVISRTSTAAYRDPAKRTDLRAIGQALGVANLVEGSVSRSGSHVHVTVQLIDAHDGHHLWADIYDRELSDVLTLQSELAREIASALRATLSPDERERMAAKPTSNPDAYVLFLQARDKENAPDLLQANLESAEGLYTNAVSLDPDFALAHARLSRVRSQIAFNYDPTTVRRAQARASAELALQLQPKLGEAHLALGYCHYWAEKDYEQALAEFSIAAQALPNEAEVLRAIGYVRRRQGRWDEAMKSFQRAAVLGPRDVAMQEGLARCYLDRREWAAAAQGYERAATLSPDGVEDRLTRARIEFHWKGDLALMRRTLAGLVDPPDPEGQVSFSRYDLALLDGDFAGAENALAQSPLEAFPLGVSTQLEKNFLRAFIYLTRNGPGDADRARSCLESARTYYEKDFAKYPHDALRAVDLGLVYAALGWRDAALALGDYAAAELPESRDAVGGSTVTLRRARIYALLGDVANVLPLAQHLLATPVDEWNGFSAQDIRSRVDWKSVRGDARFQKMLAEAGGSR